MRICVYCSASEALDPKYYELGTAVGRLLAERGHTLVYGGYNRGIMGAVASAVVQAGGEVIAVVPMVFDRADYTFRGSTRVIKTVTMSQRKAAMEENSDAFAILPGGIGTFDEFFEAFVLNSLGEMDKKIGVLNAFGYYDILQKLLEQCVADGFLSREILNEVAFVPDGESLLTALEKKERVAL